VFTAADLREQATEYQVRADDPATSWSERARLLRIRTIMLDLARAQEWINTQPRKDGNLQRTG
jgi:hypothetical protein